MNRLRLKKTCKMKTCGWFNTYSEISPFEMGGNSLHRRSATNRNWVYQSKLESELRNRVWCSKLNSFYRPTWILVPLTSLLPPTNQVEGRQCFQSCLTVILSMGRGIPCDNLSMMHWTPPYKDPPSQTCSNLFNLDVTVQGPVHCGQLVQLASGGFASY